MGTGKRVLSPSDFRYLGMFSVGANATGVGWNYSLASMTGRRMGGQVRLFVTGDHRYENVSTSDPVYEIAPPATLSTDHDNPTLATVVKAWGDIYPPGHRVTGAGGTVANHTEGLLWDDAINGFWFAYGFYYNASSVWFDPSIGVCILDDNAGTFRTFGPWRTQFHSQMTRGYMVKIPDAFAAAYCPGYTVGFGAAVSSGAARSPLGPMISPGKFYTGDYATREADQVQVLNTDTINGPTGAHPRYSIIQLQGIYHTMAHPKSRSNDNFRLCGYNPQPAPTTVTADVAIGATMIPVADTSIFVGRSGAEVGTGWLAQVAYTGTSTSSGPGNLTGCDGISKAITKGMAITVYKYDCGLGSYLEVGNPIWQSSTDAATGAVWVDTGTKHGILVFGQQVRPSATVTMPHVWYNAGGTCCHGQTDPFQGGTGPGAGNYRPMWWIYDPADLAAVLQNNKNPWDLVPTELDGYPLHGNDPWLDNMKAYGMGAWFDSVDKKLYLTEMGLRNGAKRAGDTVTDYYGPRPMIYVFQVL